MKINQLRFKNLNSLAGEWSIDFTAPEYITDGIFAIAGPTGAGKSTILDAICLALYGRTPRLKTISKSTNEIMSRQTGVCFAEVVFETKEGCYMAYWSQRRAREKADGALQNPEHELSDTATKKVLTSQLTATAKEIEKKSGMDYGRFIQSMMLAQGGFAAFLQASGNERAPILEQITGTEIYSNISIHVFERQRTEKAQLENLKAENSGIKLLSREEEEQASKDLAEKNTDQANLSTKVEQLDNAVKWLATIDTIKTELEKISAEESALAKEVTEFEPKRVILENALKALPLDAEYSALTVMRNQQNTDIASLTGLLAQTPELEKAMDSTLTVFTSAEKQYADANLEKNKLLEITQQVRLHDQVIEQKNTAFTSIELQVSRLMFDKESESNKISAAKKLIDDFNAELQAAEKYMGDNQADSLLVTELTGIKASISGLADIQKDCLTAGKNLLETNETLGTLKLEIELITNALAEATIANEQDKLKITLSQAEAIQLLNGKSIEEIILRKDDLILHLADLKKISDFDSERALLEDGKACPLCGALNHPYAEGNIPEANAFELELATLIQLLGKHAELAAQLSKLEGIEKKSAAALNQITHQLELIQQQKLSLEANVSRLTTEAGTAKARLNQTSENVLKMLLPFGVTDIPETEELITGMISMLENRRDEWQKKENRKIAISKAIAEKQAEINLSVAITEEKDKDIAVKAKEAEEVKTALSSVTLKRIELFGDKDVNLEESRSGKKLEEAAKALDTAAELLRQKRQVLDENTTRINDLNTRTQTGKAETERAEKRFSAQLLKTGFPDEAAYIACRLPANERTELENAENSMVTRQTQLQTRRSDREQNLDREEKKKLTKEEPGALSLSFEESKKALDDLLGEIGGMNEKLQANEKSKERGAEIRSRIEAQSAVFNRWVALSNLIGSADGKKYRNFAQGLTLEIMVSFANSQLVKLSDRYLLTRDRDEPLELNVIDNYQAGEIRSTKNLSGGESFIVSLALALGLSRMSSRNVRVDSLFLDEGFGTLDEETLETALGTLAGLRQDGKMIGVISHVGAMKERINTKITVTPIREGRSLLSGPGCIEIRNAKNN